MTARQPRRTRRRAVPPSSLPRPTAAEAGATSERATGRRGAPHHRQHHVTTDYTYVRKDLVAVTVLSVLVTAFVVAMSFFM